MKYDRATLSIPDGPLFSDRLRFDKITIDDDLSMWDMVSNANVMRYIHRQPETDFDAWRTKFIDEVKGGERFKFFYGFYWQDTQEEDQSMLGLCILRPEEDGSAIEVGYWVREKYWGLGLATEANKRVMALARELWALPEEDFIAYVEIGNHASRHVLEKSGLTVVDQFEKENTLCWFLRGGQS